MKIRQSVSEKDEGVILPGMQKLHDQVPKGARVLEKVLHQIDLPFPK